MNSVSHLVFCSFCSKSSNHTVHMIASDKAAICHECVVLCSEIIDEKTKEKKARESKN